MIRKKKLYKVIYQELALTHETIVAAKDEFKALKKFNRKYSTCILTSIISIGEYVIE